MKREKNKKVILIIIIVIASVLLLSFFYIKFSNIVSIDFDEESNEEIINFNITKNSLAEILIVAAEFIIAITGLSISLKDEKKTIIQNNSYASGNSKVYNNFSSS